MLEAKKPAAKTGFGPALASAGCAFRAGGVVRPKGDPFAARVVSAFARLTEN
jgi:hypothetical protein